MLVARLARRWLEPRTTDLILLDRTGRCALLLSGRLWPPAVLEEVLELIEPETDGGLTDWTAQLLNNRKERLAISGLGTERLATQFRP